jgi:hypothetical protein
VERQELGGRAPYPLGMFLASARVASPAGLLVLLLVLLSCFVYSLWKIFR